MNLLSPKLWTLLFASLAIAAINLIFRPFFKAQGFAPWPCALLSLVTGLGLYALILWAFGYHRKSKN